MKLFHVTCWVSDSTHEQYQNCQNSSLHGVKFCCVYSDHIWNPDQCPSIADQRRLFQHKMRDPIPFVKIRMDRWRQHFNATTRRSRAIQHNVRSMLFSTSYRCQLVILNVNEETATTECYATSQAPTTTYHNNWPSVQVAEEWEAFVESVGNPSIMIP